MREAGMVRDDIGDNQGIWDQSISPDSRWVRLPAVVPSEVEATG